MGENVESHHGGGREMELKLSSLKIIGQVVLFAFILTGCGDEPLGSAEQQLSCPVDTAPSELTGYARMEYEVMAATNEMRTRPKCLLERLETLKSRFNGNILTNDDKTRVRTVEGAAAVAELIDFLKNAPTVGSLVRNENLDKSARDHQREQSVTGATGHDSEDGRNPFDRMSVYAKVNPAGENISYGAYGGDTGRDVVITLAVDDNVPDRGHRTNLMMEDYQQAGVACGTHPVYGSMCVINYGGTVKPL
jgi:uncharacterized protein YkwD